MDGIPDGYEVVSGTDPLFDDSDMAGAEDYMAYAEVDAYVFTNSVNGAIYVLNFERGLTYNAFRLDDEAGTLVATTSSAASRSPDSSFQPLSSVQSSRF
jgi:hypothetical protein